MDTFCAEMFFSVRYSEIQYTGISAFKSGKIFHFFLKFFMRIYLKI
jgi:hypothetical protein